MYNFGTEGREFESLRAYHLLDQQEKAIQDFTEAIRINRQYAKAYYNRSIAHEQLGQQQKADADKK